MEQEGWLSFNEQVFLPSTVEFSTDKNHLYTFEKMYPEYESIIKTLLRAYEGIFDHPTFISEKVLAGILKVTPEEIKVHLTTLTGHRIIQYQPQKDSPQLFLLRPRMRAEDIHLNHVAYNERKEKYDRRLKEMIRYMRDEKTCRSKFIGKYLGDDHVKSCGICDNCFREKAVHLTKEEFESINHRILNTIKYESLHAKELLVKLTGIQKEKAWKVIEFLQAENKIHLDEKGWLRIK
jgi:ATP-dependent DNA helicase RecQ